MIFLKAEKFFLLFVVFLSLFCVGYAYSLSDILLGIDKTTYQDYKIPYIVWLNQVRGSLSAGYDVRSSQAVFDTDIEFNMLENLNVNLGVQFSTDFSTNNSLSYSIGGSYSFYNTEPARAQLLLDSARKEALKRKLKAIEIYCETAKLFTLNSLKEDDSLLDIIEKKLSEVDMVHNIVQLEILSSLNGIKPMFIEIEGFSPVKIEEETLQNSIVNYLRIMSKTENVNHDDLTGFVKNVGSSNSNKISAGISFQLSMEENISYLTDSRLDEIKLRSLKLKHDIIRESLPELLKKYSEIKQQKNQLTSQLIRGNVTQQEIENLNEYLNLLGALILDYISQCMIIECTFDLLRGVL